MSRARHPLPVLNALGRAARPSGEFAPGAADPPTGDSRRDFLKYAAVTAALAGGGIGGCTRQPREKIVPRVQMPEEVVPGVPLPFATIHTHDGYARGAIAESHDGRPTKLDGNPDHPASLGGGDVWMQSAVWQLYDPDRLVSPTRADAVLDGSDVAVWARRWAADAAKVGGEGVRLLTGRVTSPTVGRLVGELRRSLPGLRWHRWQPVNDDAERAGTAAAFGRPLKAVYDLSAARVVVALDADFLLGEPGNLAYARQWADARRGADSGWAASGGAGNRLWVVEPTPTITGSAADEVLRVGPDRIGALANRLRAFTIGSARPASAGGGGAARPDGLTPADPPAEAGRAGGGGNGIDRGSRVDEAWADRCAADLIAAGSAGVVIAGATAPVSVHEAAARVNAAIGAVGAGVRYIEPPEVDPVDHAASLRSLAADMAAGRVTTLLVAGCDPVATAPADLGFAAALARVPTRVSLSTYADATATACEWRLPLSDALESWTDGRSLDGTAAVGQPLILPLHASQSLIEFLALLIDPTTPQSGHDAVRQTWRDALPDDADWRKALQRGVIDGTAATPVDVAPAAPVAAPESAPPSAEPSAEPSAGPTATPGNEPGKAGTPTTLVIRPDPCLWDYATHERNAWLRELPQPITKLSWAQAVLVSPGDAGRMGLAFDGSGNNITCPVLRIEAGGRSAEVPAFVLDGQPDGVAALHLGPAAYALRSAGAPWRLNATLADTGRTARLACTQRDFMQREHDRTIVKVVERSAEPAEDSAPAAGESPRTTPATLYEPWNYADRIPEQNKWGMAIDTSACIGCNACVVACQSENNIPTVGEDQVKRGREMQWIRVDLYRDAETGRDVFQPMMCQHCENAPCEVVCPVNATVHDIEGLNVQVYNRCVGTRYCSNNCPYKVRHFNFFHYNAPRGTRALAMNPDVTVRSRGVMEKCTYCLQRISGARITAKKESRGVRDGEVVTACQQTCPTRAITFGNLNDPSAAVTAQQARPDAYGVLGELMTRPRTVYLPKRVNPAGADVTGAAASADGGVA